MIDALEVAKPVLPRSPCRLHEPERLDSRFVRRGPVPCPECWTADPKHGTRFEKFLKQPIAEPGKGGVGLRVTINVEAKAVYEIQYLFGRQVWRLVDVKAPGKKAG